MHPTVLPAPPTPTTNMVNENSARLNVCRVDRWVNYGPYLASSLLLGPRLSGRKNRVSTHLEYPGASTPDRSSRSSRRMPMDGVDHLRDK